MLAPGGRPLCGESTPGSWGWGSCNRSFLNAHTAGQAARLPGWLLGRAAMHQQQRGAHLACQVVPAPIWSQTATRPPTRPRRLLPDWLLPGCVPSLGR